MLAFGFTLSSGSIDELKPAQVTMSPDLSLSCAIISDAFNIQA